MRYDDHHPLSVIESLETRRFLSAADHFGEYHGTLTFPTSSGSRVILDLQSAGDSGQVSGRLTT